MSTHTPDLKMQRGTRRLLMPIAMLCFAVGFLGLIAVGVFAYRGQESLQSA